MGDDFNRTQANSPTGSYMPNGPNDREVLRPTVLKSVRAAHSDSITDKYKQEERVARRVAGLVVESARLSDTIERMFVNSELTSQMAAMIRDGALEYERVVTVMRQISKARTLEHAHQLAEDCLREI